MAEKNKSNEIHIVRVYDAPVKMVWDAWTDPKQVAKWWGPRGFTLTTKQKDVRPGGTWTYMMHGPDGVDYPNVTVFHEVEKYSRLVYDHGANEKQPPMFRVSVSFSERKSKTTMEMRMILPTPEAAVETKRFIKMAGGNSTWDRLAEFLSEKDKFVINRSFNVPVNRMFDLWTNPKHFSRWLPPAGFNMTFIEANIKAGGTSFYFMQSVDASAGAPKIYGKINYIEIEKPGLIIYTQIFCDKDGFISRHPLAPTWPETMLTTITLSEEGPDETRVTIDWEIHGESTITERETFCNEKAGMNQGWTGSFDKLEEYIAQGS